MHIEQAGFILRGASNNDLSITQIELVNAVSTPAKATKYTPIESPVTNAIRVNQKLDNSQENQIIVSEDVNIQFSDSQESHMSSQKSSLHIEAPENIEIDRAQHKSLTQHSPIVSRSKATSS